MQRTTTDPYKKQTISIISQERDSKDPIQLLRGTQSETFLGGGKLIDIYLIQLLQSTILRMVLLKELLQNVCVCGCLFLGIFPKFGKLYYLLPKKPTAKFQRLCQSPLALLEHTPVVQSALAHIAAVSQSDRFYENEGAVYKYHDLNDKIRLLRFCLQGRKKKKVNLISFECVLQSQKL